MDIAKILEMSFGLLGIGTAAIGIAYALIKYFSQQIFENYLSKSIETHKSNLERINISHEIQFASLHKERAIIIRDLFNNLLDYRMILIEFFNVPLSKIDPNGDLTNRMNRWSEIVPRFSNHFHRNRIYFSADLASLIDDLIRNYDTVNRDTRKFLESYKSLNEESFAVMLSQGDFPKLRENTNKILEQDIISSRLESEFRKILGVEI